MKTIITITFAVVFTPIWIVGFLARLIVAVFLAGYTDIADGFVKYLRR